MHACRPVRIDDSVVGHLLEYTAAVTVGSVVAGIGYASLIERNAFVVREVTMPVLSPGSSPLKVLHISDIHMRPKQRRKQAWLRELARWEPDFVVNTGDNLAHPKAVPAVVQALGDLLSVPGVFVFGSNDYFGPRAEEPGQLLDQTRAIGCTGSRCRGRTCGRRSPSAAGWT